MFNNSLLDDSSMESAMTVLSSQAEDTIPTNPLMEDTTFITSNQISITKASRNTENLRTYLEKESFTETEWSNELLFNISADKVNYKIMDITKYVGDSKYKGKKLETVSDFF